MRDMVRLLAPNEYGSAIRMFADKWKRLRDRIYVNPAFQRRASRFFLTRAIARRRARDVFDLCAGFVYSQVLSACVQLEIFQQVRDGPMSVRDIARRCGLSPEAASRLLEAASSLRLLEKRSGERFGLGPLGAAVLGNPGLIAMIDHHRHLYVDLNDPVALLRNEAADTQLSKYWPYAETASARDLAQNDIADYSALMAASQPIVADEVLDCYPLDAHQCLLDVGGGEGAFIAEAAARFPNLRLMVFDLPAVVERAGAFVERAGISQRVSIYGGDFFSDSLPRGADVVSLVRIALDHDDSKVLTLLKSIRAALPAGGTLLIAEPVAGSGYAPMVSAYFGIYLMAMGRGRVRTRQKFEQLLREAGFQKVSFRNGRGALQTGVVIAIA